EDHTELPGLRRRRDHRGQTRHEGVMELDDHLFRRESARLVAALTRVFGVAHLALAEDVAQDTLAHAFEAWSWSGVPAHYSALLITAAKNRALDVFRRESTARRRAPRPRPVLQSPR